MESLSNKGNINTQMVFTSGIKINKTLGKKPKKDINKNMDTAKMEIYRIKLFNEFLKHLQNYYKSYIKIYYYFF